MTTTKQLTTRQVCFIFIALLPLGKLMIMPSILAMSSNRDLYISAAISIAIELLTLFVILRFMSKNKDVTFLKLLNKTFGKTFAKILFFVYALVFFTKVSINLAELQNFIESTLYETVPKYLTFIPFFIVSIFTCLKNLKTIGRVCDILVFVTMFSLLLIIFLSISNADFSNMLPFAKNPITDIFSGSFKSVLWYGDASFLLFFMGKIKTTKKFELKIFLSFLFACLKIIAFLIIFYAIFSSITVRQYYALAKISKYSFALSSIGRFDFVAIFLCLLSLTFAVILPIFLSVECLHISLNFKNKIAPTFIVNILMLIALIFTKKYIIIAYDLYFYYINYFLLVFFNIVPIFLLFWRKRI